MLLEQKESIIIISLLAVFNSSLSPNKLIPYSMFFPFTLMCSFIWVLLLNSSVTTQSAPSASKYEIRSSNPGLHAKVSVKEQKGSLGVRRVIFSPSLGLMCTVNPATLPDPNISILLACAPKYSGIKLAGHFSIDGFWTVIIWSR